MIGTHRSNAASKRMSAIAPYLFIAPTIILILAIFGYPIAHVFYLSLQNYNFADYANRGFIGLENFRNLFQNDHVFARAAFFSVQWVVVQVGGQLLFGMLMALVLNAAFRLRGLVRSLTLIPWAVSGVLTTMLWMLILNRSIGLIGRILVNFGMLPGDTPSFLGNPDLVFFSVSIAQLWRGIPFFAVTLLAAMQSISHEIFEACEIDGANKIQKFVRIILPHLKETIVLTTLLRVIWEFNAVDLIFTLTGGGPANMTTTLPIYMFRTAVLNGNYGYGSAIGVVTFFALTIFAIFYLKLAKQEEA